MDFSWFIWFGMCLAFWICVSFAKFGEFSAIILWSTFSALPSFSPPGTRWHTFDLLLQSHRSWGLFIFSPQSIFFLFCFNWVISIVLSSSLWILLFLVHLLLSPSTGFSFWLLYLSGEALLLLGDGWVLHQASSDVTPVGVLGCLVM